MGHSPKETCKEIRNQSTRTMQRNLHPSVAYGCSSHMLTPTSWWSSQKRVPHNRSHNKESRVSYNTREFIH